MTEHRQGAEVDKEIVELPKALSADAIELFVERIPDPATDAFSFEEVATQPDEITKTYEVTLSMAAPQDYNILPGMTARVRARRDQPDPSQEMIFLPAKVVLQDSAGNFVYTVRDNQDGTATVVKTMVEAGEIGERGIEIRAGVKAGDLVLSAGMSKVSAGMKVRFQD